MALIPNEKQQEAIDILDGQVMLLAGPGTGKTFTVIHRIENMLSNNIKPSSILCLTFSDAAANEMRQRLIKEMGVIASSVDIYTYHSFCNEIIKTHPDQFDMSANVRLIRDTEKLLLIKECIDKIDLKYFVPHTADRYFYSKTFIDLIERLKSQRINKDHYLSCIETNPGLLPRIKELQNEISEREQAGKTQNKGRYSELEKIQNKIEKSKELWQLYELYSQKMSEKSLIDFSDMINLVLNSFENDENFLKEVSNKYEYFLVDEYQDTNDLQNSIIFNLVAGNKQKNIFVVGDDDQIIYGFQGAKLDSIENFLNKYPETKVICLKESNRSTQSILDFSYEVIKQDDKRLEFNENFKGKNISKKLSGVNKKINEKNKKVKRLHFGEKMQEMNYIIDDIQALIQSDNCPTDENDEKKLSEIAIICKKWDELNSFAELFKAKNIPYQLDKGVSIFSIRSTILIYFYLQTLSNYLLHKDKLFGLLISEPFKIDLEDYNKIFHEQYLLRENRPNDFISIMKSISDWKNPSRINNFLDTFEYLQTYSNNNSLRNTIIEIINRTGILEYFFKETQNKIDNIMGIKKIIDDATEYNNSNPMASLNDYVKYLDECYTNEIDIITDKTPSTQNAIQLTTFNSSKGREFECVYLPNLVAKNWEEFSLAGKFSLITEEVLDKEEAQKKQDSELLKLLFVGITRAKHTLTISFSDMSNGKMQQITKYLENFADYDFDDENFEYKDGSFENEFARIISRDVYDNQAAFKNELVERVKNTILSPSRLNEYSDCPRQFFYKKILDIDIEDADWDNANFGIIIHSLLERAVNIAKNTGLYPDIKTIVDDFQKALNITKFSSDAKKEKFEKAGMNIIESYYPHFIQTPIEKIEDIELHFDNIEVDENLVTGTIDRVEKNNDGTYSLYDYKSGTPSSSSQFEAGKSKENYYNQLCFYKYAFEKLTNKKVSQVGIIYVQDYTKSVFLNLSDDDMQYIKDKINTTYKNIRALKFDPIIEDKNGACKYCAYKHLCKLDVL